MYHRVSLCIHKSTIQISAIPGDNIQLLPDMPGTHTAGQEKTDIGFPENGGGPQNGWFGEKLSMDMKSGTPPFQETCICPCHKNMLFGTTYVYIYI